jgi:hypothetical protein
MDIPATAEARLQTEIEALRPQHPDTQDLYREVCMVLFFRHGITPTANKLYQLVRKGSMSAPAEALNRFWETLREKSRIRIEHPDLPPGLQNAAGEMMGALWQQAQAAAQDALGSLREEARAQVIEAEGVAQVATAKVQSIELTLQGVQQELQTLVNKMTDVQADLARTQGESATLQRHIETHVAQRRELQESLQTAQQGFTQELGQQRLATAKQEERHAADMRRLLLDVDRARVQASQLQKDLLASQHLQADQTELHRKVVTEKQVQTDELRQRNGELEGSVAELRGQREQLLQDRTNRRPRLVSQPALKKVRILKSRRSLG